MKPLRAGLHLGLIACLLAPLAASAWQLRGGGGGRTFVVPPYHGGGYHPAPHPPVPAYHPPPHPMPPPGPHPPGPHPMPPPLPPPPPHPDDWYHPWATAAVIGTTTAAAIAIGTQVAAVPPDCVAVQANGVAYQHCGSTWYQPQYVGSDVRFVVVPAPW